MAEIVVVGSLNLDTTIKVTRLPVPGETVIGTGHFADTGGKGANQAVAAARFGRSVAMIGAVGADADGERLLASLRADGIDPGGVRRDAGHPTGIAAISVDAEGENTIVVSPGANQALGPGDLEMHRDLIESAAVLVLQLEIPVETVAAAAGMAAGIVLLNPAPAARLPATLLQRADVLVPNQTELALLAGTAVPRTVDDAATAASRLPGSIVVTLGAAGALVVANGGSVHVRAPRVQAVDPTAAGDAFCGGLADALAGGEDLEQATRWAVRCGAAAVTRWGAQSSLPTRAEVEAAT